MSNDNAYSMGWVIIINGDGGCGRIGAITLSDPWDCCTVGEHCVFGTVGYCVLYIALTATTARPMLLCRIHSIHPLCKRTRPLRLWRSRWPSVFAPPQLLHLAVISSLATITSPTKPPNQWSCHLVCAFRQYEGTTYSALGGSPDLPGEAAILGAHLPSHCKL